MTNIILELLKHVKSVLLIETTPEQEFELSNKFNDSIDEFYGEKEKPNYADMDTQELVFELLEAKAVLLRATDLEKELKQILLDRNDFDKFEEAGVKVSRVSTKRISFQKGADMKSLREKYPNIISKKDVLNPGGISENILSYIKEKNPEAFTEEFEGDAKIVHQLEPGKFTEQSVSTTIKIEGMGKSL